jgi:apolipoprotein N-acyltransferase
MADVPAGVHHPVTGRLGRFAGRLAALTGWRRFAASAALGGLASLALPPAYAVPVLLAAFPGLLWLLDGATTRRTAFFLGWWFGFGHFLFGLYWVSFALLTDIGRFWWMMPFAAAGLPALLSLFTGLVTLALHRLQLRGLARVLAFAVLWGLAEWLRGHLFTGFPWNLIGYSWVGWLPVLQSTAVVGIYGLSLLTTAVAATPSLLTDPAETPRRAWGTLLAGLGLFAVLGAAGSVRLAGANDAMVPGVGLRVVQPNIAQTLKWVPAERERNFDNLLELSAGPASRPITHVIWPETAAPFFLSSDARHRQMIGAVTPSGGLTITGAPRLTPADDGGQGRIFNSLYAIDGSGAVVATYDKFHLVPFGEYMPLRGVLPVAAIAAGAVDFSAGPGPASLDLPGLPPVSPLICYEVIFPAAVKDPGQRPDWLLNLTNDAWYGISAGPHQHFAIARVRAVEEGLPLVRAANTGISGVVDAYGRIVGQLALGVRGVVDAPLPASLLATPYGRFGDTIFVVMLISFALTTTWARQTLPKSHIF